MGGSSAGAVQHVFSFAGVATAVLDGHGTVVRWSHAAAELLGRTAEEVCGLPVRDLIARDCPGAGADGTLPADGHTLLRHRSGGTVAVSYRVLSTEPAEESLVLAAPTRRVSRWQADASMLRALLSQDRVGIGMHDVDLTVVWTNITPRVFGGAALPRGSRLTDVATLRDAKAVEAELCGVLKTGEPLISRTLCMRSPQGGERYQLLSMCAFRVEDDTGAPIGIVTLFADTPEQQRVRRRLDVLHAAADRIGGSLDVIRTVRDLMDVLVPDLGDVGWAELTDAVLGADEPACSTGGEDPRLRRVVVVPEDGSGGTGALFQPGDPVPPLPCTAELGEIKRGRPVLLDPDTVAGVLGDPASPHRFVPEHGHSGLWAPLYARGLVLGSVSVWRTGEREPFEPEDGDLLAEIASRAALGVDNARRYTRERRTALTLQRRLLPPATTRSPAAETAGIYLPAGGGAEISGDWYDVIPLPSFRVALVAGDVAGHGLNATAAMGALRTAVRTLADLELDPSELLTHLDDLVRRLGQDSDWGNPDGATCLYVVYDPVARRCAAAGAGHPPPVEVRPDGTSRVLRFTPGPPLGVGGMPFETVTTDLAPDSVLALYTNGLLEQYDGDLDAGLRWLTRRLATSCGHGRSVADAGRLLKADLSENPPRDDIALLLARTRAIPSESIASWEFGADETVVADARRAVRERLGAWGLEELAFTTELIVSELVTNAVRYAGAPVGLRLIRDDVLVCEVTDPSNTQPRLRRAVWSDEGGRGLFLVAQLCTRWGSRYGPTGKTIWTEQPLMPGEVDFEALA
ncbi:SpoIIE family protein phosphatase [Streptomyces sp. NPDC058459]|uniref:ATP-binding SpoIIE family protein phosphatase n=1 Tax=Streptomyces sp. NPDC058459 TaxID=3346508 RepID=UPI00364E1D8A